MENIKKIGDKFYAQCYAPNSVRREVDDDIGYYTIYINDELYEMCPNQATKEEAEMMLHDIMDELGIEGNDEPVRKLIN